MLGLPKSTEFNRRIQKQKFYENLTVSSAMKRVFVEQIRVIWWRNKMVLFVGFAIPITIPDQLSTAVSILSTALLFLSIWLVDRQQQRKEQWNEVLMLSLIGKNTTPNTILVEEPENGQAENGNP